MASSNLDLVRRFFDARKRGDEVAALELLAPDVEVDLTESDSPYRGTYRGHAEIRELWDEMGDSLSENWVEIEQELVVGNRVIVGVRHYMRGRSSGIQAAARGAQVLRVLDGAIVAIKLFQTMDAAREALGMPPDNAQA